MKAYVKTYLEYFNYKLQSDVKCEICAQEAVDIHHIVYRSQGGKDSIYNLIGLCRSHHNDAHAKILSKDVLQVIHDRKITRREEDLKTARQLNLAMRAFPVNPKNYGL